MTNELYLGADPFGVLIRLETATTSNSLHLDFLASENWFAYYRLIRLVSNTEGGKWRVDYLRMTDFDISLLLKRKMRFADLSISV
jgi:hypothetical protein